jgi:V/A-type H+-transporting ATPase subunit E
MSPDSQVKVLEQALLARANELVREHLDKAALEKQRILSEVAQRLRLAEEHEILKAKQDADRLFRRRVQAAEIRMQGDLDRLRWTLVQSVVAAVRGELARIVEDRDAYAAVLAGYLASGAAHIDDHALVAELSPRDRDRFGRDWADFAGRAAPGKHVELGETCHAGSGGVILRTPNNRVRIDNTFEGRLDRLADALNRAVLEHLFASVPHMETIFHG